MTNKTKNEPMVDDNAILPSAIDALMQLQPDREWLEQRLHKALERIDRQNEELLALNAALVSEKAAYTNFVEVVRSYMADPHSKSHSLVMFYLAKAPK